MFAFPTHSNSLLRATGIALLLAGSLALGAQQTPAPRHHTLRLEATSLMKRHIGLAYDFQGRSKKSGPSVQLHFQQHNQVVAEVFHGVRVREYTEQIRDTILAWANKITAPGQWRYLGEGRPLPPLEEFRPMSSWYVKLGWSFLLSSRNEKWRLCFQPGVIGGLHRYYSAEDRLTIVENIEESWPHNQKYVVWQRTIFYAQHRSMRLLQHRFYSLSYDFGVSRMLGRHWMLEARGMLALTLNPIAGEYYPPAPVRQLSARAALLLGYMF